ncbi:ABC transporter ATP-binding protein [Thalassobacillus hwangdonensis]|uniref:ABC transporter ATP-binding protein n=1 Tax=Thalassobacillus hwangdonensis TaxID=546108 RepID=A0ABW3KZF5_9BACI
MHLSIQSLTKSYKKQEALSDVSMDLEPGIYSFLGANGSGKTTLMRIITTVLRPTSGKVLLDGKDVFGMGEEYRTLIGYVPQQVGYYPSMKVQPFLEYIGALKGLTPKQCKEKAEYWLKQVNLYDVRKKKIKKLSGGMKQRVGIAQAMLNDPKILILDEPTAGLDPKERIRFRSLIANLSVNRIVLYTTHIASDLEGMTDYVCILKKGKLVDLDRPEEILEELKGKVWQAYVSVDQLDELEKNYKVGSIDKVSGDIRVRIYHDEQPIPEAEGIEPSIEDIYLYYFGEEAMIEKVS